MNAIKKVTMGLTERDNENVEFVAKELHSRSKASAVSSSLSLARALLEAEDRGGKILIENKDGTFQELVMPR